MKSSKRDKADAEAYRLLQAQALIKLYKASRDPRQPASVRAWASTFDLSRPIVPAEVLTKEEITRAISAQARPAALEIET